MYEEDSQCDQPEAIATMCVWNNKDHQWKSRRKIRYEKNVKITSSLICIISENLVRAYSYASS